MHDTFEMMHKKNNNEIEITFVSKHNMMKVINNSYEVKGVEQEWDFYYGYLLMKWCHEYMHDTFEMMHKKNNNEIKVYSL